MRRRRRVDTVKIPRELWERVESEAERTGQPARWLLACILRDWLARDVAEGAPPYDQGDG